MEGEKNFKSNLTYQIGVVSKDSARTETNNRSISLTKPPVSYSGALILSKGVKTVEDFFKKNPFNLSKRFSYTIFVFDDSGLRHWVGEGIMLKSKIVKMSRTDTSTKNSSNSLSDQGRIDSAMFDKNEEFYQDKISSLENLISKLQVDLSETKTRCSALEVEIKKTEDELQQSQSNCTQLELEVKEREVEDRITQELSDKFEKEYIIRAKEFKKEQESGLGDIGNMLMPLAQSILPGLMAKLFGGETPQVQTQTEQGFQDPQKKQQAKQPIDLGLDDE